MAKLALSVPILSILFIMFCNSGGVLKLSNAQEQTWCVAKPSASDAELVANINFACSNIGALSKDCNMIEEGGPCFLPNSLINHASVAMNYYYKLIGHRPWNCNFSGSALITITDPSYGSCRYA